MALVIFGLALVSWIKPSPVHEGTGRLRCVTNYWDSAVTVVADDSLGRRMFFAALKPHETHCGLWEFRHRGRFLYVQRTDTLAGRWQ